jgi:hypothetical protein
MCVMMFDYANADNRHRDALPYLLIFTSSSLYLSNAIPIPSSLHASHVSLLFISSSETFSSFHFHFHFLSFSRSRSCHLTSGKFFVSQQNGSSSSSDSLIARSLVMVQHWQIIAM